MSDPFDKLRSQLGEQEWPAVYFFKFISPGDDATLAKVTGLFNKESELNLRPSRNGKYISVSVKEVMMSPDDIIAVYQKAAKIKGVISL
jgi:putative lipoic acid-binding regulatory protein